MSDISATQAAGLYYGSPYLTKTVSICVGKNGGRKQNPTSEINKKKLRGYIVYLEICYRLMRHCEVLTWKAHLHRLSRLTYYEISGSKRVGLLGKRTRHENYGWCHRGYICLKINVFGANEKY